jgi:hypothetical protein
MLCVACAVQGAVAGDIDGDGLLEIVFVTLDGRVHAIKGTDGSPIPNFPFQTGFRVQAQPTIAPLDPHNPTVQHILIMSFDGFLYAINGKSGCAHAVDIGENSYAAVLVDDLCGDGNLELLVSTMNGNVYVLQTQARYHPLKTWTAQVGPAGLCKHWCCGRWTCPWCCCCCMPMHWSSVGWAASTCGPCRTAAAPAGL